MAAHNFVNTGSHRKPSDILWSRIALAAASNTGAAAINRAFFMSLRSTCQIG
jgi:hypothetical protein